MKSVRVTNQTRQTVLADNALVADSVLTRVVGLLGHSRLEPGAGLLIVPCNSIHSIGMRFLFDAVFLDKEGKVVHLIENMKSWRASKMVFSSHSVLELPGGVIAHTETQLGDLTVNEARC